MIEYRIDRITRNVVSKHPQGEYAGDDTTDAISIAEDLPLPCYQVGGTIVAGENPYAYAYNRIKEYPSIPDQLDMLFKDMQNGTSEWKNLIAGIKSRYPKPQE
jgi:hypothetical protein